MSTIICFDTKIRTYIGDTQYGTYEIIDGQQRITTLILLLKAIEKRLTGSDKSDLQKDLVKSDGALLLLQTNSANESIFSNYLVSGSGPDETQITTAADVTLANGITECEGFVAEFKEEEALMRILRLIKNRLGFVVYDTIDGNSVYSVFEVLNSRGRDLDTLEKCKAALMGKAFELGTTDSVRVENTTRIAKVWGDIYSELAMHDVSGFEIVRAAATLYVPGVTGGKLPKAQDAIEGLLSTCKEPEDAITASQHIHAVTKCMVQLLRNKQLAAVTEISHARVLAVALNLSKELRGEETEEAMSQWERITFRTYGLAGKDSRFKVGDYIRLAKRVCGLESPESKPLRFSEVMNELRKLGTAMPIDTAVEIGFANKDWYNNLTQETRYFLWRYEIHLTKQDNALTDELAIEKIWEDDAPSKTIEHIFPQNPETGGVWASKLKGLNKEDYVHRIGNLTLLENPLDTPLNAEAGRRPFPEKKKIYGRSGLRMVRKVMEKEDWNPEQIEARERILKQWALTEWGDK